MRFYGKNFSLLRIGRRGCFDWNIPNTISPGTCKLDVNGEGEYTFTESQDVTTVERHEITVVQTDKPVYKPKDKGNLNKTLD